MTTTMMMDTDDIDENDDGMDENDDMDEDSDEIRKST